jgi:chemotaxis protein MotB
MDLASFHVVDEVGAMVVKEVEKITSEVEVFVFKNKLAGQVDVSSNERVAIITLSDTVLFPAGKSRMTSVGNDLIKQVFDLLQQFNYNVKLEGHTDDSPIRTEQFPSIWELSAACAAEVARELVEAGPPHVIVC